MTEKAVPRFPILPRAAVYDRLVGELVDRLSFGPVAISTGLPASRGAGRSALARRVCQDPRVVETYPDGVLWANLAPPSAGQAFSKIELVRRIDCLLTALTGRPSGITSLETATQRLREVMHPRSLLLVLEDPPDLATLEYFQHTGPTGACLIISRQPDQLPFGARVVTVDGLLPEEAQGLLAEGHLPEGQPAQDAPESASPVGWERLSGQAEELDLRLAEQPTPQAGESRLAGPEVMEAIKRAEQAQRTRQAGIPAQAVDALRALAGQLNHWPLLLALVNGWMLGAQADGDALPVLSGAALAEQAQAAAARLAALAEPWEIGDPAARDQALDLVLDASLEAFSETERACYHALAVFPAQEDIPLAPLLLLWAGAGLTGEQSHALVERLALRRLIERAAGTGWVRVPGWIQERLAARLPAQEYAALHDRLVQAYQSQAPAGWESGPDDGYSLRWLPYHLVMAGRRAEAQALLFRFGWLLAFVNSRAYRPDDMYRLLEQYDLALSTTLDRQSAALRLAREALLLSLPAVVQDRQQLAAQMLGRLLPFTDPDIQSMLAGASRWDGKAWLRPTSACFPPPGSSEVRVMEGHRDWVSCVAVLPDGRFAVSGSLDGTLRIWDLSIGQVVREQPAHKGGVLALAVLPDGLSAASSGMDGRIRIWDLNSGEEKLSIRGHAQPVGALLVDASGDMLISGSEDHNIRVWEVLSGERLHEFSGHTGPVRALALTPDGRSLVSGAWDNSLRIWDMENGQPLHALTGMAGWVQAVAISPDGYQAISAGWDRAVRVWDLWTAEEVRVIEDFDAPVLSLAVLPDQSSLLVGAGDGKLHVFDYFTGQRRAALSGHTGGINSLAVTHSGHFVISAAADTSLRIWDLVAILGSTVEDEDAAPAGHNAAVFGMEMLPDGVHGITGAWDGTLKVWDVPAAREAGTLSGHSQGVLALAVDAVGKYAISGARDQLVKVWDIPARQEIHSLSGHAAPVSAVAITPDGRRGVSGASDGSLIAWDLEKGASLAVFHGDSPIHACRISADGQSVMASGAGGKMYFLRLSGMDDV